MFDLKFFYSFEIFSKMNEIGKHLSESKWQKSFGWAIKPND
jgi:hypothetical protein